MIKKCVVCGKEFTPADKRQKYCSPECSKAKQREQAREAQLKHQAKVTAQKQAVADVKSGWLTIPDAPNYEISPDLRVRNKKTKHILQGMICYGKRLYLLRADGKPFKRNADTLRRQSEAAALVELGDEWYPVPSLDNRYEFNDKNQLRITKTKHLMRFYSKNLYHVCTATGRKYISIANLRWEVFGEIPPFNSHVKKPVIISKGLTTRYFDNRLSAAKFIAATEFYSPNFIRQLFVQRQTQIYGWTINYLEDETTQVGGYLKGMQTKDPRQAKKK